MFSNCASIIGMSAANLSKSMIEVGEDNPKCFPNDLDVILGCTLTFKVKFQSRSISMSVMKVSNDVEIIEEIKGQLQSEQHSGQLSGNIFYDLVADT
ncbi:hypothetical protein DEO72_LG11g1526 [Vigna unguiculata]|uniref:Uncharacterized protein n=1 Tax=Vigna unguiculata TaxID=3917 RepID=A0A4D6NQH8_VIGUN|nr:hypothetical protein DEO72_LG11g1526 [Vigna unguiculata]